MKQRTMDLAGSIEPKHVIIASVAVTMTVLALSYGGYGTDTLSLLALTSWTVILVGLGFGFLPRARLAAGSWVTLGLIAGLTAWTALSIGWADDAGIAYIRAIQMAAVLGIAVLVILTSRPGEGRAWINGLTLGLGAIVALAAISRFVPVFGTDAELTNQLGEIMGGRLSWPLGYWNALGLATALFLVLCLWHSIVAKSERVRTTAIVSFPVAVLVLYLCSSRGSIVAAVIGTAVVVGLGPGRRTLAGTLLLGLGGSAPLILLASRFPEVVHAGTGADATVQGLILLAATIVVCVLLARLRIPALRWMDGLNLNHKTVLRVVIGLGAIAVVVVIASSPADRFSSFTSIPVGNDAIKSEDSAYATQHLLSKSGNGRWQLWETAVKAFGENPVKGLGGGGFEAFFKTNGSFWMKTIDPHSTPLEFLAEQGAIGFLLLLGVVGFPIYAGIRRYRALGQSLNADEDIGEREELGAFLALLAIGIFSLSIDWTGQFPVIFGAMVLCIAALAGPLYSAHVPEPATGRRAGLPIAAVVASMLLAGVMIVSAARQYEATRSIDASRDAFASGNGPEALKQAERAISATPWAASSYAQLASVQAGTGDGGAALSSAEVATGKAPLNDSYWLLLSKIQIQQDLRDAALISVLTAKSLNPNSAYWTGKS